MLNDELKSRVVNWKFSQAIKCFDSDTTKPEKMAILELADMFGDSGHFEGTVGKLVSNTVYLLLRGLGAKMPPKTT